MEVVIRKVTSGDVEAVYINNNKVNKQHVNFKDIRKQLRYLIKSTGETIHNTIVKDYHVNEEYAENNGFPLEFDEIPKDMFE